MSNEQFFTDVVKDVIGNDPVVDQFDTYYEASFYGTMQDDYITGSMLAVTDVKNKKFAVSDGSLGTRGRAFSIYYAESQPPLESTYGSAGVALNPFLSKRVVPWKERSSSTSYRLKQLFDGSERYYDSCLPDLVRCFKVNNSEIWTINNKKTLRFLSPYENFATASIGYLFFNYYAVDRAAQGFDNDTTTNNKWTWSYPYETKYFPNERKISSANDLGLNFSTTEIDYVISSSYPAALRYNSDLERYSDSLIPTTKIVKKTSRVDKFVPLLPGFLDQNERVTGSRNGLRNVYTVTSHGQSYNVIAAAREEVNDRLGTAHSVLIPSDVDFSRKVSHDYLNDYVDLEIYENTGPEYLTSSMNFDDTVKFLFGFGDLNNMSYGKNVLNLNEFISTFTTFSASNPSGVTEADYYSSTSDALKVTWLNDIDNPGRAWKRQVRNSTTTIDSVPYSYLSGSSAGDYGIFWSGDGDSDEYILASDTDASLGGEMNSGGITNYSYAIVDVTSSYPWSLKYRRAVATHVYGYFFSAFASVPGIPIQENSLIFPGPIPAVDTTRENLVRLETIYGTAVDPGADVVSYMQTYDSIENGWEGNTNYPSVQQNLNVKGYPFEPGEYRIIFGFVDPVAPGFGPSNPYVAAIRDFEIKQYVPANDANGNKIGGNNYPKFKKQIVDNRFDPAFFNKHYMNAATGNYFLNTLVTGSSGYYSSLIHCVSPEIRGWKYGLISGFPTHSKAIFRRDKYGQFRDMLEQRPYTKFINVLSSPLDNDAITIGSFNVQTDSRAAAYAERFTDIGPSAVAVNFVKQRYRKNDKGVGYIYNEKVDPLQTYSQNLSSEVTSSLPYFDGVARHRQDQDLQLINNATITSLQLESAGLTVV